jgi:hypothetical protein
MDLSDLPDLLYDLAYWLIVSALLGVPFMVSLYVLVTPRHKLLASWQNFRMSRSRRVFKDRHFKNIPRILILCKIVSLLVFILTLWAISFELGFDLLDLFIQ